MSYNKDSDKQGKTELNISSHQQKDKDKSGDYMMHGSEADKNKNENKHEKTSITFERKKVNDDKDVSKDKDLKKEKDFHYENKDKDLNKDWNKDKDMQDKSTEGKGIIGTIKEKVKDVLGSGDNDKSKDKEWNKEKDVHIEKNKENEKFGSSTVGVSSGQHASNLGTSSSGQYSSGLGASSGQHSSGLGAGQYSSSSAQYSSNLGSAQAQPSHLNDNQFATIDKKNLGAEHREVGYDKQANVIPSKEKEKDTTHKVDVHGSLYTSGAGSTFKTNEAK